MALELDLALLTQHLGTFPPIQHIKLRSVFYPSHAKGPILKPSIGFILKFWIYVKKKHTMDKLSSSNLSPGEHQALKHLTYDPNIIIKTADKGGGIVLQDREGYIAL